MDPDQQREEEEWKKEALGDLHLRLSEKHMAYRELVERCLVNP